MYYYLDTVLRLWHFTGAEREAREFRRKLVYKTGFCMRYLLRADRPKLSSSPLSYISSFTSKIYESARALSHHQCKPMTFGGLGPLQPPGRPRVLVEPTSES